ncbi:hypothetical protein FNH22_17990 [Fulvivirga sp. M361]|uniref:Dph6-related ATP pyrophosphatase n=1 Tax=Fulvivirga sp. M361 TaxID=2594266 RepID=UPI00117AA943|nr:hypothetical protein [Fulvivirga sp. M361]TRX55527.1 hypothetical protein FNH22_17990 [Fulvivirga sp. M361]
MEEKQPVSVAWSGGKNSAFAFYKILQSGKWEVEHIHTVFDVDTKCVRSHGIHEDLIEQQASVLGIPLKKQYLDEVSDTNAYQIPDDLLSIKPLLTGPLMKNSFSSKVCFDV